MKAAAFSDATKRLVADRADGLCEIAVPGVCVGVGSEFHHRRPRSSGGSRDERLGRVTNCLLLCVACHRFVESRRSRAYDAGWLVRGWDDPADCPVLKYGATTSLWLSLTDAGGYEPAGVGDGL